MSILSLAVIIWCITTRLIYRRHQPVNQCLILIYNLLIADAFQAFGFVTSFNWLRFGGIFAPTKGCWCQGAFINLGDVSSGFFVLAIAIHTFFSIVRGQRIRYLYFCFVVVAIWALSLTLALIGPLTYGADFYTRAGNWCWISEKYDTKRLWLHYIWIFIDEFATVIIYAIIYGFLLQHLKISKDSGSNTSTKRLKSVAKLMGIYPVVYVVLTLPLATARMMSLGGHENSNTFLLISGALLTSCGFVDSILYPFTRPVLFADQDSGPNHPLSLRRTRRRVSVTMTPTGLSTIIRGGKDIEELDMDRLWQNTANSGGPIVPPKSPRPSVLLDSRVAEYGGAGSEDGAPRSKEKLPPIVQRKFLYIEEESILAPGSTPEDTLKRVDSYTLPAPKQSCSENGSIISRPEYFTFAEPPAKR